MTKLWDDFLLLSNEMLEERNKEINQVAIRRVISNAYYAVFQLIIHEGVSLIAGKENDDKEIFNYFQRSFDHGSMKAGCEDIRKNTLPSKHYPIKGPFPLELTVIAYNFIELQKARHEADYDYYTDISIAIAEKSLNFAKEAIEYWNTIVEKDKRATKQFVTLLLLQKMKRN